MGRRDSGGKKTPNSTSSSCPFGKGRQKHTNCLWITVETFSFPEIVETETSQPFIASGTLHKRPQQSESEHKGRNSSFPVVLVLTFTEPLGFQNLLRPEPSNSGLSLSRSLSYSYEMRDHRSSRPRLFDVGLRFRSGDRQKHDGSSILSYFFNFLIKYCIRLIYF